MKVEVQDSEREQFLRRLFGLLPGSNNRIGVDAVDAVGRQYELKSTTKGSVSTARDVNLHTIEKWRKLLWICARGENTESGFSVAEIYYLHPLNLEEWFKKIERQILRNRGNWVTASKILLENGIPHHEVQFYTAAVNRGSFLNDPNIPWSYIQSNGVLIKDRFSERLAQLVEEVPRINTIQPKLL